ncbi:hypothetical protein BJX66DRAFT_291275 [Aspergillus keveii]|uniref:Uncharacterized protein n=1 Tax=Aspergillus keveii TaxID=714993 RepID=A0ABR4GNR8_9EURO
MPRQYLQLFAEIGETPRGASGSPRQTWIHSNDPIRRRGAAVMQIIGATYCACLLTQCGVRGNSVYRSRGVEGHQILASNLDFSIFYLKIF